MVLAVKALAGNFLVNYSSLSNSSLGGRVGRVPIRAALPYCGPPSRGALTAEAGLAPRCGRGYRKCPGPDHASLGAIPFTDDAGALLNLFFTSIPTTLHCRCGRIAIEKVCARHVSARYFSRSTTTATWDETFGLLLRIHAELGEREKNKIILGAEKASLLSHPPFPAACCSAGARLLVESRVE